MSSPLQWPPRSDLSQTSSSSTKKNDESIVPPPLLPASTFPQARPQATLPPPIAPIAPTAIYQQQQPQFVQNIPQDMPSSLRPLQPQPYTQLPLQQQGPYDNYTYSRAHLSQTLQSTEPTESDHDNKRMRVSRACDGCRRKKIKCDTDGLGSTCKSCRFAKTVCTFKDSAKKRGPPKGYIEVLENRLKRMEKLLGGMTGDENPTINDGYQASNHPHEKRSTPVIEPTVTTTLPTSEPWPASTTSKEPTPPSAAEKHSPKKNGTGSAMAANHSEMKRRLTASPIAEIHPRYIGDMSTLPFLAQKFNFEDDRFTSNLGIKIRRFGQSLVIYENGDISTGRTPNQLLLEKLGMLKPGEPINGVEDWISKVADITKVTSDRLMKVYFAYIHPGLPVVNKTLFLNQYRGLADDYPSAPLLNAMYGAAIRYIETCQLYGDETAVTDALDEQVTDFEIPEGGSERLFDNLIKYVRGKYSPNIATIQALVIAQNHRASMDAKMTGGWLINAAAIRMAQDLGLQRSSENWDISEGEKETRRRVWWAVYIMDKWSAASTGRPQTIFDEDCDESYPSESASWEEVMDMPAVSSNDDFQPRFPSLDKSVAQKATGERIPIYQPFVQLVKLSEILGHILQGLYTPRAKKYSASHGSDAIVSYLDKALSEWRAALPPTLQISGTNLRKIDSRGRTPLLSMSGLMYLSYCTLLILLHRPFIEKEGGEKTKSSVSSLSICTSAATRCVDVAASMHFRDFLLVSWNFAIYHVFTASLIHIHTAANTGSIVSDVARGDLVKSVRVVKRLSNLSTAACHIHHVLLRLMKMANISYDEQSSDEEIENRRKRPITKSLTRKGKTSSSTLLLASTSTSASSSSTSLPLSSADEAVATTPRATKTSSATAATTTSSLLSLSSSTSSSSIRQHSNKNKTTNNELDEHTSVDHLKAGMSPRISDVGRGQFPGKSASSPSNDTQLMPNSVSQYEDRLSSAGSTPSSLINGDWINGLYSSIQQDESQGRVTNTNMQLESDPHSLRQFGMNMEQMFTPIDQMNIPNDSANALSLGPTQQYNFASDSISQNFLFGFSNIGFTPGGMQQPSVPSLQPAQSHLYSQAQHQQPSATATSASENSQSSGFAYPMNMSIQSPVPNGPVPSQLPMVDHSLFRNRPDNPFWSVPSSIEMDDWTAYLLPTQEANSTSESELQMQQQEQRQHQQQTWPSSWL